MFQFSALASLAGYGRSRGLPHSEILGSKLVCQLPEAYRRLLRLSSPVAAKESTRCAWSLDHITSSILPIHWLNTRSHGLKTITTSTISPLSTIGIENITKISLEVVTLVLYSV